MAPGCGLMQKPGRQAGGAVGQRVAVGIGGVGVEAVAAEDEVTLGVGAVTQVGAEDRRPVGVGHRPGEASVSVSVPSLTVTSTVCTPALAKLRVPLMAPVLGLMLMPSGRPVAL